MVWANCTVPPFFLTFRLAATSGPSTTMAAIATRLLSEARVHGHHALDGAVAKLGSGVVLA